MEEEIERRFKELETKVQKLEKHVQELDKKVKPEEIYRVHGEEMHKDMIRKGIRTH